MSIPEPEPASVADIRSLVSGFWTALQSDPQSDPQTFLNSVNAVLADTTYPVMVLDHLFNTAEFVLKTNDDFAQLRLNEWNTVNVTGMDGVFSGCGNFDQSLSDWNMSSVISTNNMFRNCTNFNQSLASWDMSNVENAAAMFGNCTNFNQSLASWNMSSVINTSGMFENCTNFNQNVPYGTTDALIHTNRMFYNCANFNQDVSQLCVTNVTSMESMFYRCAQFTGTGLPVWDTSKALNMDKMFYGCVSLNVNLDNWNVPNVTEMGSMFQFCWALEHPMQNWSLHNDANTTNMFRYAHKLQGITDTPPYTGYQDPLPLTVHIVGSFTEIASLLFPGEPVANVNMAYLTANLSTVMPLDQDYRDDNTRLMITYYDASTGTSEINTKSVIIATTLNIANPTAIEFIELPPVTNRTTVGQVLEFSPLATPLPILSSHSGGDPYVFPCRGPPVELPHAFGVYRLYQDAEIVINAQVEAASPEIQRELGALCSPDVPVYGAQHSQREAYFYTRIHLFRRRPPGTGYDSARLDVLARHWTTAGPTFSVGPVQMTTCGTLPFDTEPHRARVAQCVTWYGRRGRMTLSIAFLKNPQTRFGISLSGFDLRDGDGLLIRNYKPKVFAIRNIDDASHKQVPIHKRKLHQKRVHGTPIQFCQRVC